MGPAATVGIDHRSSVYFSAEIDLCGRKPAAEPVIRCAADDTRECTIITCAILYRVGIWEVRTPVHTSINDVTWNRKTCYSGEYWQSNMTNQQIESNYTAWTFWTKVQRIGKNVQGVILWKLHTAARVLFAANDSSMQIAVATLNPSNTAWAIQAKDM
jgi:hypothetical protein